MRNIKILTLSLMLVLLNGNLASAAKTVNFEPVRAPSKGPDNAPVTIVEIADFM